MAQKKKTEEPEEQPAGEQWDPEMVRRFRMKYDAEIKDGVLPKDARHILDFEGRKMNMAFAHYMLEYFETCIFWPPQSRAYNIAPDLPPVEPDKS